MNEDIKRVVRIESGPNTEDGIISSLVTDKGWRCLILERPDVPGNVKNADCIPRPARYWARFEWSDKERRNVYHIYGVPGRDHILIHAANVYEQLEGCLAPGLTTAIFTKDSLHAGMPSRPMHGVTNSGSTLNAFHVAMQDDAGRQEPFWLEIS